MPATPSHGHPHGHGPDPDAPPPTPEALARRRRAVWLMLLLLVPVGLATVIGLVVLWPGDEPTPAEQVAQTFVPPGTTYPDARVVSLQELPCGEATCATAVVEVLEGEGAGDYQQVDLQAEVVANGVAEGDTIVLSRVAGADGGVSYGFSDFARTTPMVVLAVVFAVVVGVVARLRGLAALVGLAFAFFVLLQFVLPGLLAGESPTLVSLVGSAAIMFVVLYLAHGFSARTTTALVGTLFGLALVTVLGAVSVDVARLTGLTSEETTQLLTFDPTLDFSGLVIAGCVVAGLGVLNDVTITQASAIWQLHEVDPAMGWRDLYRRGMAVGRDHIASTVYTIVFAYAGAALPLLLLFEVYARPAGTTLTSSVVAEEVIRTLVGGIALVLATPVTTAVGAFFATVAGTATGAAPEQRISALRARFAR
ncbi:putative membrane protein [Geodermatophilus bullaregiensis]|uniref:YibE/F family protein n=1 Tax=Geodermatophilus bullaregiensis TaxID=1564160 RepID=UPI0027DAC4D9|nr:YibE/F family protein [Geodermatophilus bullaregiensis]MBM7808412.1 putative membrane protein [Geodermatophilus bullaregiensis]